ncbi:MAG: argininosuccinate lyase [Treponema sp.]|nr:argininosuccinate lyase [Treponema sp.]MBQ7881250.1 argininosuccinate lyase [Treponema sp.]
MSEKNSSHGTITNNNHAALWHGRFAEGPDAAAVEFETSIYVDERMAIDDINGSKAHAQMLCNQGIISSEENDQIQKGLDSIEKDLLSGNLEIDYSAEDIHSFVEATLTDRIGDAGKKVHTGRSRNDQIALDERLYLRRAIPDLQKNIASLIKTLSDIAREHTNSLLTGYTHMQHAQPGTLAQHLCAWAFMLVRDYERLSDSLKRVSLSPLGSGALAGSGLPLDREFVAKKLGFDGVTHNSLDSVSDRDYCIEFTSDFALLQSHLSRMCEEIVLWATTEFGFIDLSEKWSTGSSIMPQKKNPDFAELIRGRTGKVYGNLINLLVMMKGLPLSYDRDMQEDKAPLFEALDTVKGNLIVFEAMISSAKWNKDKMAASCYGGFANATDVADYLVRKGMPFRTAHGVAAQCVRLCIEKNFTAIEELSIEDMKNISDLFEVDIFEKITPEACMKARKTTGGPAPEQTDKQILFLQKFCEGKF